MTCEPFCCGPTWFLGEEALGFPRSDGNMAGRLERCSSARSCMIEFSASCSSEQQHWTWLYRLINFSRRLTSVKLVRWCEMWFVGRFSSQFRIKCFMLIAFVWILHYFLQFPCKLRGVSSDRFGNEGLPINRLTYPSSWHGDWTRRPGKRSLPSKETLSPATAKTEIKAGLSSGGCTHLTHILQIRNILVWS